MRTNRHTLVLAEGTGRRSPSKVRTGKTGVRSEMGKLDEALQEYRNEAFKYAQACVVKYMVDERLVILNHAHRALLQRVRRMMHAHAKAGR